MATPDDRFLGACHGLYADDPFPAVRAGDLAEAHRYVVDVDDPAARSPVQQDGGDPGFLLQSGCSRFYRGFSADGVQLPEDTGPAACGEVLKIVQRERYEPTPHEG